MDSWSDSTSSLMMAISGTLSTDATLSGLTLEGADGGEAITLSPAFPAETFTYRAAVVNQTDAVKLKATKNDDNAKVVITNDDDQTGSPEEALLDLSVGSNTLTVTVTAQDGTATRTYTVTVERHTADTWVSNTHLSRTASANLLQAQSFETGANTGGYTVSEVDIRLATVSGRSTSVKIRKNNADNEPGDLVASLTNPGTLTADSLNTFTAPAGTTLAASTTYWITVNEGISSNRAQFALTDSDDEAGETGWTIGDGRLWRGEETQSWSTNSSSLLMTIKGTAIPTTTLVSNTHLSATDFSSVSFLAQSFETGANAGGYTVSEVDIRLGDVIGRSTTVKIRENNADNEPGDLVTTLANPGTLTADSLNTFTAPVGTTLDASTPYWLTVNEGISSDRVPAIAIQANDETGETGWSIGDGSLWRGGETDSWSTHSSSLLITIKGTAIPTISLVSNTHLRSEFNVSSTTISAQKFETGANLDGYTVSEVDIPLTHVSGNSSTIVKIRENNATNRPGNLVATLTNPASLTADSLNTFTAPPGTTLAANKTYWLTMGEGISTNRAQVETHPGNDETGEPDWSIGDGSLWKLTEDANWQTNNNSLLMTIKGTVVPCDGIWCATLTVQDSETVTGAAGTLPTATSVRLPPTSRRTSSPTL